MNIFKKYKYLHKRLLAHLESTMSWLLHAQSITLDKGVSQAYFVKNSTWNSSYPETTGYIIPTLFDYYNFSKNIEIIQIAIEMADWESKIQLAEGAVQAGTIDSPTKVPTIFNTGQVIFGWARAYLETLNNKYLKSLTKASDWLCDVQDDDGAWRKFASTQTKSKLNTYNTRTAWGVLQAYQLTDNRKYLECAIKNADWALTQQLSNGWWENNCLLDNERPFTHTIAYAMRGFLEIGDYLKIEKYINAALLAAKALLKRQKRNGSWPGQFNRKWKPQCKWSCLTGNSQLAVNFIRLYEITGDIKLLNAAQFANRFNMSIQDIETDDTNIRGGIPGSWPIDGKYHPFQYPNWAAKFFADALMAEIQVTSKKDKL